MIKWIEKKTFGAPMFYATISEWKFLVCDDVSESLVALINDRVLPLNGFVDWNALVVELWLDTGSLYLFPAKEGNRHRIEKCGVHLVCDDLSKEWDALEVVDAEFDVKLQRLHLNVAHAVAEVFRRHPPFEAHEREASLFVFEADEAQPLLRFKL